MTSELIQTLIEIAPDDFHTVACVSGRADLSTRLPYIALKDVEDGNARVLGANKDHGLASGSLPALLLFEQGDNYGSLFCIWHRDHGFNEEHGGVRLSVSERDKVRQLFQQVLKDKRLKDLCFKVKTSLTYSYMNDYQAFAITVSYTWQPGNCINGTVAPDGPYYTPGIY